MEDMCATLSAPPSCPFGNKEGDTGRGDFFPALVPGGRSLLVPGPFLLALCLPWFPGDWGQGIKAETRGKEPVAAPVSSLTPSLVSLSDLPAHLYGMASWAMRLEGDKLGDPHR